MTREMPPAGADGCVRNAVATAASSGCVRPGSSANCSRVRAVSSSKPTGSPSGSLLAHMSKVTVRGPSPCGGSGLVLSTAFGARFVLGPEGGVVVVVTAGRVVVVLTLEAMVVSAGSR